MNSFAVMQCDDWWWLWAHCLAGYGFSHTIVALLMMMSLSL